MNYLEDHCDKNIKRINKHQISHKEQVVHNVLISLLITLQYISGTNMQRDTGLLPEQIINKEENSVLTLQASRLK